MNPVAPGSPGPIVPRPGGAPCILLITLLAVVTGACASAGAAPTAVHAPSSPGTPGVDWRPWEASTFAEARREHRLVLVSVQARWCHWCHVMNHTTYLDPEVRRLLRDHFVTIRVDSDERRDLAERYARWGWPATAILTPDAQPITELRGHQPARRFATLLRSLGEDLEAGRPLGRRPPPPAEADPLLQDLNELRTMVAQQLACFYDEAEGGWGTPQKYPFPAPVEYALFRARVHGDAASRGEALRTLEGHARLIDREWGGMYQYSVGGSWGRPHYEKIATIQAGAIHNFAAAYAVTGDPRWLNESLAIYRYVSARFSDPRGGFYTSQDADVGEFGAAGAMAGEEFYGLSREARMWVGAPRIDRSIYADLNGRMVTALIQLYEVSGEEEVLDRARAATDRLLVTHRLET